MAILSQFCKLLGMDSAVLRCAVPCRAAVEALEHVVHQHCIIMACQMYKHPQEGQPQYLAVRGCKLSPLCSHLSALDMQQQAGHEGLERAP